jgi:hypothetical protein
MRRSRSCNEIANQAQVFGATARATPFVSYLLPLPRFTFSIRGDSGEMLT